MKKIIVVDDNVELLEVLTEVLESEGLNALALESGENLEERIDSFEPDCLLLDVVLPGVGGDELSMRLKSNLKYSEIPILLMSANAMSPKKFELSRANDFVAKPFDNEMLIGQINKLITNRREVN